MVPFFDITNFRLYVSKLKTPLIGQYYNKQAGLLFHLARLFRTSKYVRKLRVQSLVNGRSEGVKEEKADPSSRPNTMRFLLILRTGIATAFLLCALTLIFDAVRSWNASPSVTSGKTKKHMQNSAAFPKEF